MPRDDVCAHCREAVAQGIGQPVPADQVARSTAGLQCEGTLSKQGKAKVPWEEPAAAAAAALNSFILLIEFPENNFFWHDRISKNSSDLRRWR